MLLARSPAEEIKPDIGSTGQMQNNKSHPQAGRSRTVYRSLMGIPVAVSALAVLTVLAPVSDWFAGDILAPIAAMAARPDSYSIRSPLELSKAPRIVLEQGVVIFGSARNSGLARPSGLKSRSARRLKLKGGLFTIDTDAVQPAFLRRNNKAADGQPANIIAPMLAALAGTGFADLELVESTLIIHNIKTNARRRVSSISARITKNNANIYNAKGSFKYRGREIAFTATLDGNIKAVSNGMVPFKLEMNETKNRLLAGNFSGMLGVSNGLQLEGEMQVRSPDLRQAANWMTGKFPTGPGLKKLKVQGTASLINNTLSFKDSKFEVDGNVATGGLAINFTKKRPSIVATLAAKSLNLDPYFEIGNNQLITTSSREENSNTIKLETKVDYNLLLPAIRHFDADVRLSADKVRIAKLQIGKAAAAVSLQDGQMHADVVELFFAGGNGVGQITADMSGSVPRYSVRGRFESSNISEFSSMILGNKLLSGEAVVTVGMDASALTFQKMLKALSGKIRVAMPKGGYIGINPLAMAKAAKLADLKGWKPLWGQVRMSPGIAVFAAKNGILKTVRLNVTTGGTSIVCKGLIDLTSKHLNMKIRISKVDPALAAIASAAGVLKPNSLRNFDTIRLHGNWHKPTTHLESHPQRPLTTGSTTQDSRG